MTDTTKTIYLSGLKFLSGTLISRVTGFLRDIAMAFAFGTESSLAAFMVAFRFAHLARRLFGEGSLQNTFIPHFEELRGENPERAFAFFRDLSASLIIGLSGIVGVAFGLLIVLLHAVEWSETTRQVLTFTAWMLPSLIFICLYGLNSALLACEKSYFIAGVAPVAFNLVWIAGALAFSNFPQEGAMLGLSSAVVVGCFAQMCVTLPSTFHLLPKGWPHPFSPDVRRLLKPLLLANLGVAASQINNALDPLFALFANTEGPAWLWYAIRVQQLPLALFGIALSNALLPPISRAIKSGNLEQFRHFFQFAEQKILSLTFLISAGIFAVAPSCINLLFGRGQFGMESVEGTSLCLIAYAVGLFPMTYVLVAAPTLFAFGDFKTPVRASCITMAISVLLNFLFIFVFHWSAASVALSTSLAAFWNAYYLSRALKREYPAGLLKIAFVSFAALTSVWGIDFLMLGQVPSLQLLQGLPLELSQKPFDQISLLGMEAIVFLGAALISAYVVKLEDFGKAALF